MNITHLICYFLLLLPNVEMTYSYTNPLITIEAMSIKSDLELIELTKLVNSEAWFENSKGKIEVLGVVIARLKDERFPNNIIDVIHDKGEFDGVSAPLFIYTQETYDLLKEAYLKQYTSKYLFYYNPEFSTDRKFIKWVNKNYTLTRKIGNHKFHGKS